MDQFFTVNFLCFLCYTVHEYLYLAVIYKYLYLYFMFLEYIKYYNSMYLTPSLKATQTLLSQMKYCKQYTTGTYTMKLWHYSCTPLTIYWLIVAMVTIPVHAAWEMTTAACRLSVVAEMFLISDGLG